MPPFAPTPPADAAASATPSAAVARAEDATGAPPASIGGTYAHADGGVLRVEHTAMTAPAAAGRIPMKSNFFI